MFNNIFEFDSAVVYFPKKWLVWECVWWMSDREFTEYSFSPRDAAFSAGLVSDFRPGEVTGMGWQFRIGQWFEKENKKERNKKAIVINPIFLPEIQPKSENYLKWIATE